MKIRITQEEIDEVLQAGDEREDSRFNHNGDCPICRAVRAQIGEEHTVRVWFDMMYVDGRGVDLPVEAQYWQFNAVERPHLPVAPIEFEIHDRWLDSLIIREETL